MIWGMTDDQTNTWFTRIKHRCLFPQLVYLLKCLIPHSLFMPNTKPHKMRIVFNSNFHPTPSVLKFESKMFRYVRYMFRRKKNYCSAYRKTCAHKIYIHCKRILWKQKKTMSDQSWERSTQLQQQKSDRISSELSSNANPSCCLTAFRNKRLRPLIINVLQLIFLAVFTVIGGKAIIWKAWETMKLMKLIITLLSMTWESYCGAQFLQCLQRCDSARPDQLSQDILV